MEFGKDGRYHVPITIPAEIHILSRDPIELLSLLKPCITLAVEASELFDLDKEECTKWKDILIHYPEYPVKKGVFVNGLDTEPENHPAMFYYRAYPVFPGGDGRKFVEDIMRKTFRGLKDPMVNLRLGKSKIVRDGLYEWLRLSLKPNGFLGCGVGNEAPPVKRKSKTKQNPYGYSLVPDISAREKIPGYAEISSDVLMITTEMLMQSYGGLIRLFPGMVGKANARFGDLRAEGAFLVSSEMVRGKVTFVSITAEKAGTAEVKNPWGGKPVRLVRRNGRMERARGPVISVAMKEGEEITLVPNAVRVKRRRIVSTREAGPKTMRFKDGTVVTLARIFHI